MDPSAFNSLRVDALEAEQIKKDLSHLREEIEQADLEDEDMTRQPIQIHT